MTRIFQIALSIGITVMLAMPTEVLGQNRRNESRTGNTTEQRSTSNSSSRSSSSSSSRSSSSTSSRSSSSSSSRSSSSVSRSTSSSNSGSSATKARDFGLQVDPKSSNSNAATTTSNSSTSRRVSSSSTTRTTSPANTSQNRRTTNSSSSTSRNNSSNSRSVSTTSRSNSTTSRSNNSASRSVSSTSRNNTTPRTVSTRPNNAPAPRSNWERPYLRTEHRPAPSYRYGNHHFGYRLNTVPHGAVIRVYNNVNYYYYDGIYYRPYSLGGYIVCRPPVGTYFANTALNIALTIATINAYNNAARRIENALALSRAYAAYNTRYTVRELDSYVTNVALQNNGNEYYYQDGVFYTLRNNQYYVIEPPIGALVEQLPEDYEEIVLDGHTYYQVENALYKVTVIEGALYFEVVCAL